MRRVVATVALALLVSLAGCGDEQTGGPTTSDFESERAALAAKMKEKARRAKQRVAGVVQTPTATEDKGSLGGIRVDFVYDPTGKRDPFRSFRWDRQPDLDAETVGPLEQYELEQLSVVAVVWDTHSPRALVADPSGRSYIVMEGTRVGKNDGLIIHIGDNLVLVKETYVDFGGGETTKDVELRIRRSQGG